MIPFYAKCPDIGFDETRFVNASGFNYLPDDNYAFIEYYCEKPDCDCRRVIVIVTSNGNGNKILATINYGWESPNFYAKWMGNKDDVKDMVGATLEPFGDQTNLSRYLLELFKLLVKDESYVERLRKHYEMFKGAIKDDHSRAKKARVKSKRK